MNISQSKSRSPIQMLANLNTDRFACTVDISTAVMRFFGYLAKRMEKASRFAIKTQTTSQAHQTIFFVFDGNNVDDYYVVLSKTMSHLAKKSSRILGHEGSEWRRRDRERHFGSFTRTRLKLNSIKVD